MIIFTLFALLVILALLFVLFYLLTLFTGGWFIPTPFKIVTEIIRLVGRGQGRLFVDLGSGTGYILKAAANRGFKALGLELNPFLFLFTKIFLIKEKNADVKLANFWKEDLSKADVVFVYLPLMRPKLEKKLKSELKKGSTVIAYQSPLPNWKPQKVTQSGLYVYRK